MTTLILLPAIVFLVLLLSAEKKESIPGKLATKPLLSALFVFTAWHAAWPVPGLARWVMAGLILSWIGDVFLVFYARPLFMAGLLAFLSGHVCYAIGFLGHGSLPPWALVGVALVAAVSVKIFFWLRPHLGPMTGPVIAYITVITAMVTGALALFAMPHYPALARWLVLSGALCFYASDVLVARDRFVAKGFDNHLYGLPLYYAAQFFFAFAIGLMGPTPN
ncbi:MAG: lysoplasmalogenase [Desulfobacterales bacterium]|nr:lysoplasmalogenase [Desulfobacterales bacterium]